MFIPVQLILYWDRILIDHARKLTRVLTCVHHNFGLTAENGGKKFSNGPLPSFDQGWLLFDQSNVVQK